MLQILKHDRKSIFLVCFLIVINNRNKYSMAVFLNLSENIDAMPLENENQLMFKNSLRSLIQYLKSLKIYDVLRFSHLESA